MSVEPPRQPFPGVLLERELRLSALAEMFTIAWAPDGGMFATGGRDGVVRLWQRDGRMVAALAGHERAVLSVAFSPAGRLLASGSSDHSVRLWDLDTLTCIRQLTGHSRRVTSVAWSGDGGWLVSGSDDGAVRRGLLHGGNELHLLVQLASSVTSVAVSATRDVITWVDFRVEDPPPIEQLIWGITKVKPASGPDASAR